jgi:3-hydroxyisobutyrate dehydrogenase-like beta-hydroxyacid dehydrogenase
MKKIAVIGIGIMGNGIATNFLKNGYKVTVWNRHSEKLINLKKTGAIVASSPRQATEYADIIFEVTANDKSSQSVWLGENEILAGANSQKVLIECSTISISWVDKLIKLCKQKSFSFFDMAMTGGRIGAETGKLIFLVGGDKKVLDKLSKDLKAISGKIMYFGSVGSGMRFKLLLNMLQAIHIIGLGEVLKIAKSSCMNLKTVGDALAQRPGGTTTNLAWRDYQKEPNPINFSVEWITKDLNYTKQFANKLDTPLLNEVLKKYQKAITKKLSQKDWTIVNKI